MMREILFIQGGGGHDVHDAWDNKLVDSLERELGAGYEVRYPRMPDEDDPTYAKWAPAIRQEIESSCDGRSPDSFPGTGPLPSQGNSLIVVGHSIGGAMLINALAEMCSCEGRSPDSSFRTGSLPAQGNKELNLGAIVLISVPFVGEGGWPADEFATPLDLGARLPRDVPVHLFQGLADETTPPAHADLYRRAIPQAEVHKLPGRDHQLNNDLSEVAKAIGRLEMSALSPRS